MLCFCQRFQLFMETSLETLDFRVFVGHFGIQFFDQLLLVDVDVAPDRLVDKL